MFTGIILICNAVTGQCDHRILTPLFEERDKCVAYAEASITGAKMRFQNDKLFYDYQCVTWETA